MDSVTILAAVAIGGPGRVWGPYLGVAVVFALPEALRLIGMDSASVGNIRQIVFGFLLFGVAAVKGDRAWRKA